MTPQVSAITLAVRDIERAKEFYTQGLGCRILQEEGGFVSLELGQGSSTLALYGWEALAEDAGVAADSRFPRVHAVPHRRLRRTGRSDAGAGRSRRRRDRDARAGCFLGWIQRLLRRSRRQPLESGSARLTRP